MSEKKEDIFAKYLQYRMGQEDDVSSQPDLTLVKRALNELDGVSLPTLDIDRALEEQKSKHSFTKLKKVRRLAWMITAAAVALVLITILTLKVVNMPRDLHLPSAEVMVLPDGVSIALSHTSAGISYSSSSPRKLALQGNAFFQVSSGAPFEVRTDWGSVTVLGTSFEIIQDQVFEVTCFTGRIEISVQDQTYVLKANEKLRWDHQETPRLLPVENRWPRWIDDALMASKLDLHSISSLLEYYHKIEIHENETGYRLFRGQLPLDSLGESFKILENALSIQFRAIGEGQYEILEK